jgi:putative methionine-R-sulfoxide reductase with GAF domain
MFQWLKDIIISENDQDASYIRLFRTVLGVTALATFAIAVMEVFIYTGYSKLVVVGGLGLAALLTALTLLLSLRKILWPGKVIFPLALLVALVIIAINSDGTHDPSIPGLTLVILVTSLIDGRKAIPLVTFLAVMGIGLIGYADMTGITQSSVARTTGLDNIAILTIIQVVAALVLNSVIGRLDTALTASIANEQSQIKANLDLTDLRSTLEERVAARTKDLATVAEVSTATATILRVDQLLQAVVDLTKERFNLYHAHIYLLDERGGTLVLASGAGKTGRQMVANGHSIPLSREQSLVARAARERKGVTVNDVTQAPDFLPNPLLPATRSELAVPMVVGDMIIGVFDIQSDQVGRFTDTDINIQTTLAAQVATSVQNVRSFEQARSQADFESLVNVIGQKIQHTTSVEDTLQTAIRELESALGASRVKASLQPATNVAIANPLGPADPQAV